MAYAQLGQVLELVNKREVEPIILGDFNIYNLSEHKEKNLILCNYTLSSVLANYISYPDYNGTLDYIAVPKSKFKLSNIKCPDTNVSDHRAIIGEISTI